MVSMKYPAEVDALIKPNLLNAWRLADDVSQFITRLPPKDPSRSALLPVTVQRLSIVVVSNLLLTHYQRGEF